MHTQPLSHFSHVLIFLTFPFFHFVSLEAVGEGQRETKRDGEGRRGGVGGGVG